MRRLIPIAALALALAACSNLDTIDPDIDPDLETTAAETTTTTLRTGAPATTVPPEPTTTTTEPPTTTTAGSETTEVPATTTPPPTIPLADLDLRLVEVAAGFDAPVLVHAPPGDDRLFVLEQPGRIELLRGSDRLGTFLSISGIVAFGGERGLLGLAFHPGYPTDPRFYVHYSAADGAGILAEYPVSADPDRADPDSGRTLLRIPQPASNHNGGMIAFGPDGLLYMGLGDGGAADDRFRNGQNTDTLLGSIIRIDVDGGDPYAIPPDNPFADGGGAAEIWAYGLRNPWRFAFDGDFLFIGDVGQNRWEEIDVIDHRRAGANFGWPILEGFHCFGAAECDRTGLVDPVLEYPHEGGACSVTGGYVYRGTAIPELNGAYFYGDYCSGEISSFRIDGEGIFELRYWDELNVPWLTSFGIDGSREIYAVSATGSVFRIERG